MAAPRIATYADWKREFLALAEHASLQGHVLRAGFYWRSAEFFMRADDPERKSAREKFLEAVQSVYGRELGERHAVPYADGHSRGFLPAYRFKPPRAKCTIVFFGGYRTVARPDKNAQECAFDYRAVVYAERKRAESLPSRQLWSGPENHRPLAGRYAGRKERTSRDTIAREA